MTREMRFSMVVRATSRSLLTLVAVMSLALTSVVILRGRLPHYRYHYKRQTCYATMSQQFKNLEEYGDEVNSTDGNKNARWQSIGVNQSYVYSAYLDDRDTPDVAKIHLPVARVFAVFPRQLQVVDNWRCLFWFNAKPFEPAEVGVAGWTNLNTFNPPSVRVAYAMLLCPIPYYIESDDQYSFVCNKASASYAQINNKNVTGCSQSGVAPIALSIIPKKCSQPVNFVWLVNLPSRRQRTKNPEFMNQTRFTICVPPVFGHESNLKRDLIEFIQVNRLFGAQRFFFFVKTDQVEFLSCLQKLRLTLDHVIIEWVPWKMNKELSSIVYYHGQIIAINECIYRLLYLTQFVISKDLDEFIVPTIADDWNQMLERLPCSLQSAASYSFRNRFLWTNWPERPLNKSFMVNAGYHNLSRYHFRTLRFSLGEKNLHPWKSRSKIMARPDRIILWHVHEILDSSIINRAAHRNCYVDGEEAILFHYRSSVTPFNAASAVSATRIMENFASPLIHNLNDGVDVCYRG